MAHFNANVLRRAAVLAARDGNAGLARQLDRAGRRGGNGLGITITQSGGGIQTSAISPFVTQAGGGISTQPVDPALAEALLNSGEEAEVMALYDEKPIPDLADEELPVPGYIPDLADEELPVPYEAEPIPDLADEELPVPEGGTTSFDDNAMFTPGGSGVVATDVPIPGVDFEVAAPADLQIAAELAVEDGVVPEDVGLPPAIEYDDTAPDLSTPTPAPRAPRSARVSTYAPAPGKANPGWCQPGNKRRGDGHDGCGGCRSCRGGCGCGGACGGSCGCGGGEITPEKIEQAAQLAEAEGHPDVAEELRTADLSGEFTAMQGLGAIRNVNLLRPQVMISYTGRIVRRPYWDDDQRVYRVSVALPLRLNGTTQFKLKSRVSPAHDPYADTAREIQRVMRNIAVYNDLGHYVGEGLIPVDATAVARQLFAGANNVGVAVQRRTVSGAAF